MCDRLLAFVGLILVVVWLCHAVSPEGRAADDKDQVLFNFADEAAVKNWAPVKLSEVEKE